MNIKYQSCSFALLMLYQVAFLAFLGNVYAISNTNVWMTVSSLASSESQRNLEVHWKSDDAKNGDWVGVFSKEPTDSNLITAIEKIGTNGMTSGSNITKIQFPYRNFPTGKLISGCLGYFVAYVRNNVVITKDCIKNNPFWMENHLDVIGNKTIAQTVLPGTHDAGSYEKYGASSEGLIKKFSLTQDESIYNQLVYGIRYLDLRVGYDLGKIYIVHGWFRTDHLLEDVAIQIKNFLIAAPKEVIIVDFHSFERGFEDSLDRETLKKKYGEFMQIISRHFGEWMIPFKLGYGVTINELIKLNKRVLVGFAAKRNDYIESDLLWPNVVHQWGDKDDIDQLEKYFDQTLCRANRRLIRSAMSELTPEVNKVIKGKYGSLRMLAQISNSKYTQWFGERWWNCVNIIAADFFLGSNVVDIAIQNNIRLGKLGPDYESKMLRNHRNKWFFEWI